jgi:zinc transport system substrate-binding protein
MRTARSLLALAATLLGTSAAIAEVPRVVASIKPVEALVAAVMGDLGTPDLLVKGTASPHSYSLRPSDAAALQQADIIFWTGHQFEVFLEDALGTLAPNALAVALGEAPGITLLPVREGGAFEGHDHAADAHDDHAHDHDHDAHDHDAHDHDGHDHEAHDKGHDDHDHAADAHDAHAGHDHGEMDMHTFLDPGNAKAMVDLIERTLADADPDNAAIYAQNAAAERLALDALITTVSERLAPVRDRPIVVFHDAYQYFEARFGLNVVGSVTVSPESLPGADRISEIRDKLKTLEAACVFAEPNFDSRIVDVLVEGSSARTGTLDPEGAALEPGPRLYDRLILGLADGLLACLAD